MIPVNITRDHILQALEEISRRGIPPRRQSTDFVLIFEGKFFPPKYVISLANKYANGYELEPSLFSGGQESNTFLTKLGFEISGKTTPIPRSRDRVVKDSRPIKVVPVQAHSERCPACKESIKKLLERLYGEVHSGYSLGFGTFPEDFAALSFYGALQEIYSSLQQFRGHTDFVRSQSLPPVDYFVPSHGLIVEFDESQHFTTCRKLALSKYPSALPTGFSRERWIRLCDEIGARDNEPVYRDEQRAWYDALRDFAPLMMGLRPTIRLFARDLVWCSLNPGDEADVRRFESVLAGTTPPWDIEVRADPAPKIARIVIAGNWSGNPDETKSLLKEISDKWPQGRKVEFLITCGGFVEFDWPKNVSRGNIGDNLCPSQEALENLIVEATRKVRHVLSDDTLERLAERTGYIALGVDSSKKEVSRAQNYINQLHIELVALVNSKDGSIHWTGKSYPTSGQQGGLVRFTNLESHFTELGDTGTIMVLGCHDLKMFDPRHYKRGGMSSWREEAMREFHQLARRKQPNSVLHHPHETDCVEGIKITDGKYSPGTWDRAWEHIQKVVPTVQRYAAAAKYQNSENPGNERSRLADVLRKTKRGDTIDFIVRILRQ